MLKSKAQLLVDELVARRVLQRLALPVPSQLTNESIFARHCTGTVMAGVRSVTFSDGSKAQLVGVNDWRVQR